MYHGVIRTLYKLLLQIIIFKLWITNIRNLYVVIKKLDFIEPEQLQLMSLQLPISSLNRVRESSMTGRILENSQSFKNIGVVVYFFKYIFSSVPSKLQSKANVHRSYVTMRQFRCIIGTPLLIKGGDGVIVQHIVKIHVWLKMELPMRHCIELKRMRLYGEFQQP